MTLREALQQVKKLKISRFAHPVELTVADELRRALSSRAEVLFVDPSAMNSEPVLNF